MGQTAPESFFIFAIALDQIGVSARRKVTLSLAVAAEPIEHFVS
jgi:hypothetical protein